MDEDLALEICQKCKSACCKLGGPDFTKAEMTKVLKAGHKNYFVTISPNHFELKSKKGICPYLTKDNSCSIHDERPLMCKCWPVFLSYKDNDPKYFLIECPLTRALSKQDIQTMKKQASLIPKEIITTCFSGSKLTKSNLKLIEDRFNRFKHKPL